MKQNVKTFQEEIMTYLLGSGSNMQIMYRKKWIVKIFMF